MKDHANPFRCLLGVRFLARPMIVVTLALANLCAVIPASAQLAEPEEVKLPNGKSQRTEIAKANYQSNLRDARELARLTAEIQTELEQSDALVLPLKTLKKVEQAEKLAKTLRARLQQN